MDTSPFFLLLTTLMVSLALEDPPVVCDSVPEGTCYKGAWIETEKGNWFAAFRGLKYGQDPIGELRFKAPQSFKYKEDVVDVSKNSQVACCQPVNANSTTIQLGQEDCLVLNIYVPESAFINEESLPVMAWIHGGGLTTGVSYYDDSGPQMYMDRDVVLVTINYRLGVFGFFSLGDDIVPGNAGLRDQNLALKWIKDNIFAFYGNSDKVTVFGESAGAQSVGYQMISPMSRGLFRRAILQSGTPLDSWASPLMPDFATMQRDKVLQKVGCGLENALACMQSKKPEELLIATSDAAYAVVDSSYTTDSFLPADAEELLKSGQFDTEIEIMIGTTKDEGILMVLEPLSDPSLWHEYQEDFDYVGPLFLFQNSILDESRITEEDILNAKKVFEYYLGSIDNFNEEHKQEVFDMFTDSSMLYGSFKTVNYFLEHEVSVYQYILTYVGDYSLTQFFGIEQAGVCHADDLFYLFNPTFGLYGNYTLTNQDDINLREEMTSAWTNFAKFGDPTPPDSESHWKGWTPLDKSSPLSFWNISGMASVMSDDQRIVERMAFWETLDLA